MRIGEKLKEARMEQDLSLEHIQKETKIQVRHLEAIETGDFSLIPGSFYVRAFIKEYATVVDLNPEELLTEYKDEIPALAAERSIDYTHAQRSKNRNPSAKSSPLASLIPTIFVVLLIVGIGFIIWWFTLVPDEDKTEPIQQDTEQSAGDEVTLPSTDDSESDETTEDPAEDEDNQEEPDLEEEQEIESTLTLEEYSNNESVYQFVTGDEEIELVLETNAANWLEISDQSGESYYYGTFQSGESPLVLDFSGQEQINMRFGEPSVISISINDIEVELSEEMSPSAVQRVWINIESDRAD